MGVRETLVELLHQHNANYGTFCDNCLKDDAEEFNDKMLHLSDHLIANGVTVQELALSEQDYYVLRNTETGMYFRGKGVNRWGEHFNQATIYRVKGTAEHSIKEVAWHGEKAELVRIKIVEMPQPPKGE